MRAGFAKIEAFLIRPGDLTLHASPSPDVIETLPGSQCHLTRAQRLVPAIHSKQRIGELTAYIGRLRRAVSALLHQQLQHSLNRDD
jgi:hypothetical protein